MIISLYSLSIFVSWMGFGEAPKSTDSIFGKLPEFRSFPSIEVLAASTCIAIGLKLFSFGIFHIAPSPDILNPVLFIELHIDSMPTELRASRRTAYSCDVTGSALYFSYYLSYSLNISNILSPSTRSTTTF